MLYVGAHFPSRRPTLPIDTLGRVRECIGTPNNSGSQYARSPSLGVTTRRVFLEEYWDDHLAILKVFAERRNSDRSWLRELPFFSLRPQQQKLCRSHSRVVFFGQRPWVVRLSFLVLRGNGLARSRVSPLRKTLHPGLDDWWSGCPGKSFRGLVTAQAFHCGPRNRGLVEARAAHRASGVDRRCRVLGLSSLRELTSRGPVACFLPLRDHPFAAPSFRPIPQRGSSVRTYLCPRFSRLSTVAFITSISPRWRLKSLSIGPMYHEAGATFWEAALREFQNVPRLTKAKITYGYPTSRSFNISCWSGFNTISSNRGATPRLVDVDI
jgi:hypothetical protein